MLDRWGILHLHLTRLVQWAEQTCLLWCNHTALFLPVLVVRYILQNLLLHLCRQGDFSSGCHPAKELFHSLFFGNGVLCGTQRQAGVKCNVQMFVQIPEYFLWSRLIYNFDPQLWQASLSDVRTTPRGTPVPIFFVVTISLASSVSVEKSPLLDLWLSWVAKSGVRAFFLPCLIH